MPTNHTDSFEAIPAATLETLLSLKDVLATQGVIQLRSDRRGSYRLRYRQYDREAGCSRHRSLDLGRDEAVAYEAQRLLEGWRAERNAECQEARRKAAEEKALREERKVLIAAAQKLAGGGRDRRARVAREINAAMSGSPVKALAYIWGERYLASNRSAGRPAKAGFW